MIARVSARVPIACSRSSSHFNVAKALFLTLHQHLRAWVALKQRYPSSSLYDSCSRLHRISRVPNRAPQPSIEPRDHHDAADQAMGFLSFSPSRVRPTTMPVRCILWSRSTTLDSSDSLIDQPTIFLENKSITMARNNQPSNVGIYVKTYCVISSSKNRADTNPPTLTSFTPQPPTD